jgi:Flp pilus assembly protein TadD
MKCFWTLLPMLLLAACSTSTTHGAGTSQPPPEQQAPHLNPDEIHDDLIRQMLNNGQYYAALAHIEEQKHAGQTDQLTLLEADARGHLGQVAQADALYRRLLGTRYAPQAYHGLGRLYVKTDLDGAIRNLRKAVEGAPTDVDFRNDLGYALMEAGRYTEAMTELSTAAELAPNQLKSQNNLIILMMLVGNKGAMERLEQLTHDSEGRETVPPERLKDLRDSAQSIRERQNARRPKPQAGGKGE